jgi:choline kinase
MPHVTQQPSPPKLAIILAAGVGSRLRPTTSRLPKCLVPVAGRPILEWQLRTLFDAGLERAAVVAGYRHEQVAECCRAFGSRVRIVVNEAYATTNNMVSLRLAVEAVGLGDVLLCNGDVMFDPAIPAMLLAESHPNLIAGQKGRFIAESMKIVVNDGRVAEISKHIQPERAWGVSIDIYRFDRAAVARILDISRRVIDDEKQLTLWTEVAIDAALAEIDVRPLDIGTLPWVEIDTPDDLAEAGRLFPLRGNR